MEEVGRLHKDVPFGWVLWLMELRVTCKAARAARKAARAARIAAKPNTPEQSRWVTLR